MGYIINKTDGSVVAEVNDGLIDKLSLDITLVGKNANAYGESFNENFVKLLESFANTSAPARPITGQLWFDTSEERLKVYDGDGFKSTTGTIVSNTQPFNMTPGDLWVDTERKQLYFYDGESTILAGPPFANQKETGFIIEEIADNTGTIHTIIKLYIEEHLLGIISKDTFTPQTAIPEYSGDVNAGFTVGTYVDFKLNMTCAVAEALLTPDGLHTMTTDDFVTTTDDATLLGQITFASTEPIVIGSASSNDISSSTSVFEIASNYSGQEVYLTLKNSTGVVPGLYLKPGATASQHKAGIFTDEPTTNFDVVGDALITGTLTVEELTFSGSGPISLHSNNDLSLSASGWINLNSLTTLPRYSTAQLLSFIGMPAGTIAYCTDAAGGACPVFYTGASWLRFSNNVAI